MEQSSLRGPGRSNAASVSRLFPRHHLFPDLVVSIGVSRVHSDTEAALNEVFDAPISEFGKNSKRVKEARKRYLEVEKEIEGGDGTRNCKAAKMFYVGGHPDRIVYQLPDGRWCTNRSNNVYDTVEVAVAGLLLRLDERRSIR
jgi:hypothetical protein